jgi:hypothetical protein
MAFTARARLRWQDSEGLERFPVSAQLPVVITTVGAGGAGTTRRGRVGSGGVKDIARGYDTKNNVARRPLRMCKRRPSWDEVRAGDGMLGSRRQGAVRRQQQLRGVAHRPGQPDRRAAKFPRPGERAESVQSARADDRVGSDSRPSRARHWHCCPGARSAPACWRACCGRRRRPPRVRVRPRTLEQLSGSLRALGLALEDATLRRLDEIWPGPGGEAPEAYAW